MGLLGTARRAAATSLYLFVGFFVYRSTSFRAGRQARFAVRGKDYLANLKRTSKLMYVLEQSFQHYSIFANRTAANHEWQKRRWSEYASIYYRGRDGVAIDPEFVAFLSDALSRFQVRTVLDLGCGGFFMLRQVAEGFPSLTLLGMDITDESEAKFKQIAPAYSNVRFIRGGCWITLMPSTMLNCFIPTTS